MRQVGRPGAGALALCWTLALAAAPAARAQQEAQGLLLEGTIGKLSVQMRLFIGRDDRLGGTYLYKKYQKDIPIEGETDLRGEFTLRERDASDQVTGIFRGKLQGDGMSGTWSRPDGSRSLPFTLTIVAELGDGRLPEGPAACWAGEWTELRSNQFFTTQIQIDDVRSASFHFDMEANSGAHVGEINGIAKLEGDRASFRDEEGACELTFRCTGEELELAATQGCYQYGGEGVVFDGRFRKGIRPRELDLVELGVLSTPAEDAAFRRLVGADYETFASRFHLVGEEQDQDGFRAAVRTGGVRGLYSLMAAIVMIAPDHKIWAAVREDDAIRYYTSEPLWAKKLPKTLEAWREQFQGVTVEYRSAPGGASR